MLIITGTLSLLAIVLMFGSLIIIPDAEAVANAFYAFFTKWGSLGSGNAQFKSPYGIAIDYSTHEVYVADSGNQRIQKFQLANPCPSGTAQVVSGVCFVTKWGNFGSGIGKFNYPLGIDVDPSTHEVYVADSHNHRIQMFTNNGDFIKSWGKQGSANGQLYEPTGVAVDPSSHDVYVADSGNQRIQKFTHTGTFITKWGSYPSTFGNPFDVAVDASSHDVYVSDSAPNYNRINKFKLLSPCPAGTTQVVSGVCLVTKWGGPGTGNQFGDVFGIAVDSSGRIYAADSFNNRIFKFQLANPCLSGTAQVVSGVCLVTKWGTQGSANGQFKSPFGIGVDTSPHRVFVADTNNHRIQVFFWKVLNPPSGTTAPLPH